MRPTDVKDLTNVTQLVAGQPGMGLSIPALLSLNHTRPQVPGSKVWSMWYLLKETELEQVLKAPFPRMVWDSQGLTWSLE